jgi:hypothetical protein
VSYDDEIPIREDLLTEALACIAKHKGKHVVLKYDIAFQTWTDGAGSITNAWALVLVVNGALLGRAHWLSYTWTFQPPNPIPPDERDIDLQVAEAFKRLSLMQVRQLQTQSPQAGGNSPN